MTGYSTLTIESPRLRLAAINLNYVDDIATHFTAEVTQYMWPSAPKSKQEIIQHITSQQAAMHEKQEIMLAILIKDSAEFLGVVAIHQADTSTPELGVWLKTAARGNHYGLEAVRALKQWAEAHLSYQYLKYPVDKRNIPSCKLAEKLSGRIEDTYLKKSESGFILDEVEYRFYFLVNNKK